MIESKQMNGAVFGFRNSMKQLKTKYDFPFPRSCDPPKVVIEKAAKSPQGYSQQWTNGEVPPERGTFLRLWIYKGCNWGFHKMECTKG